MVNATNHGEFLLRRVVLDGNDIPKSRVPTSAFSTETRYPSKEAMQILTLEGWTFEAMEAGPSSTTYYKLWEHALCYPCGPTDVEFGRALTGFFNSSRPAGHSDYEDLEGSGYTPDEQKLLEIFYDDEARMSHKRVFYYFDLQNDLVTKVQFFLRWTDAGFDETFHETRASRRMKEDSN